MVGGGASPRWGYVRIIAGTVIGGIVGFYVMHRVEISYKVKIPFFGSVNRRFSALFVRLLRKIGLENLQEKMKERLRKYESEMKRKQKQLNELDDSV